MKEKKKKQNLSYFNEAININTRLDQEPINGSI